MKNVISLIKILLKFQWCIFFILKKIGWVREKEKKEKEGFFYPLYFWLYNFDTWRFWLAETKAQL